MGHGEHLRNAYASFLFFWITGSEHDETMWTGAYHKCDQRRFRGACACVQSRLGLAAHQLKVLKRIKTKAEKNLDIDLRAVLLSMRTSILYEFYGFLSSRKREPTKRLNTMDHHTYAQTHKPRCELIFACFCIVLYIGLSMKQASSWDYGTSRACDPRMLRRACTPSQSC